MNLFELLRMFGALALVLGGLAGALWAVRRYDLKLPARIGGGDRIRRLELVERLSIDQRRAVALIRRDGAEHLILLAPEGNMVVETAANPAGYGRAFPDFLPRFERADDPRG
ncbi:flagellar biosynthetic protein FliO [Stakelama sp. CBK3Z-3]|uniref:Flagellar biosynthetic protein FliO n=1 Tax=Stakelama flava TaxID=2860338 RepID=A0ABS6XLX2_9SPHN|nr:flagellar biosynthetic protein FliO [Stakelama flava]MBW4330420.1 flagellar biosynthetic protein FliO [Stakelama flava]